MDGAKRLSHEKGIEVLLLDADMVFGRIHVDTAVEHADRAFRRGTNVAETRMMEVMLYVSGERQLSTAIAKMGVKENTKKVAVIVSDESELGDLIADLGLKRDDKVIEGKVDNLARYGIPKRVTSRMPKKKALDLVLERVALVDLLK